MNAPTLLEDGFLSLWVGSVVIGFLLMLDAMKLRLRDADGRTALLASTCGAIPSATMAIERAMRAASHTTQASHWVRTLLLVGIILGPACFLVSFSVLPMKSGTRRDNRVRLANAVTWFLGLVVSGLVIVDST